MKRKISILILVLLLLNNIDLLSQTPHPTVQEIINDASVDSLLKFVEELSGERTVFINGNVETINSRHKLNADNDLAADYIKQKLEQYGLTVTDQWFSSTGRNVYAEQVGSEFPDKKYMICAHYDDMPSGSTAPGADDNASGTAAVIEAARLLTEYDFPYTIIYALWDEEEQGLVGSDYYAGIAASANEEILGVINLDMIAWEGDGDNKVRIHTQNDGVSNVLSDKMVEVNSLYSIGLMTTLAVPGSPFSDHKSFWDEGYAAILLIEDDAGDFNPYYHTTNDLITHFDQQFFLKCSQLAIATLTTFSLNVGIAIAHAPFGSTNQTTDLILTADVVTSQEIGSGPGAPHLYYRTNSGSGFSPFYSVAGSLIESVSYNFTIPAQPLGTAVQYYLAAQDAAQTIMTTLPEGGSGFNPPGFNPPYERFEFYVADIDDIFVDNASSINNWTATAGWNLTTESFMSSPTSFTDSPNQNYPSNTTAILEMNEFVPLNNAIAAELKFHTKWEIESNWDYGQVQVSTDGNVWTAMEGNYTQEAMGSFQPYGEPVYDANQLSWVHEVIDLSDYLDESIKIRFILVSDQSIEKDGWYVDDITIVAYKAVPVELTTFEYELNENSVKLIWQTASEVNNYGFEIERAIDDENNYQPQWENIGFVEGKGTTSEVTSYLFNDIRINSGKLLYRLKQIDYDGKYKFYGPIEIESYVPNNFVLEQNYPNPFNPATTIKFSIANVGDENIRPLQTVKLIIYDLLGREVATLINEYLSPGNYEVEFNAEGLSSGIYYYRLDTMGYIQTKKMILTK